MSGGPPDKWTSFAVSTSLQNPLSSTQVLAELNNLASQGYYSAAVSVQCSDGLYVFVAGYE